MIIKHGAVLDEYVEKLSILVAGISDKEFAKIINDKNHWCNLFVNLEFPLGEIAINNLQTLALTGGIKPTITAITGKDGFIAQGLEGKCIIKMPFRDALLRMALLPKYRGQIVVDKKQLNTSIEDGHGIRKNRKGLGQAIRKIRRRLE